MPALQSRDTAILSTVVNDINVDVLQKNLEVQRNTWIDGYLAKDFSKIETVLSADFRCINGKEISSKQQWHEILQSLWQSTYWNEKPILPDRTRYHFFTPTECMVTLYFKNEARANVMQELWMATGNVWRFNALSVVNR